MKIHDLLGKKAPLAGDVGLELEMEGKNLPFTHHMGGIPTPISQYWAIVRDGSLRGGAEYILNAPVTIKELGAAFVEMEGHLQKARSAPEFSVRTSVHVHVNVQHMTFKQVMNYVYIYLLCEDVLTSVCGSRRMGNRFCLRASDAEGVIEAVRGFIRLIPAGGRGLRGVTRDDQSKYGALNLNPLGKQGSVEFRSMEGTKDWSRLIRWSQSLVNLREYAKNFDSIPQIFDHLQEKGAAAFFQEAIGERAKDYLVDVEGSISYAASFLYDLYYTAKEVEKRLNNVEEEAGGTIAFLERLIPNARNITPWMPVNGAYHIAARIADLNPLELEIVRKFGVSMRNPDGEPGFVIPSGHIIEMKKFFKEA